MPITVLVDFSTHHKLSKLKVERNKDLKEGQKRETLSSAIDFLLQFYEKASKSDEEVNGK